MYIAKSALFLAIADWCFEVNLCSNPSTVAALIRFLESNMFWSLFKHNMLFEATAINPISDGLDLRTELYIACACKNT